MKVTAICLVKNEADIIAQSLSHAAKFCDKIYVLDNGSTDGTWEYVRKLSDSVRNVVPFRQDPAPFDNNLRGIVYEALHESMSNDDWWMILDADEFMATDPRPAIGLAAEEGADCINAWQATFYYTTMDLRQWENGLDSRDRPICERRRFYRIDHKERRIFRNRRSGCWADSSLLKRAKKARNDVVNRHYPLRDPPQIASRLDVRFNHPAFATQVRTTDFIEKVRSPKGLVYLNDGDPLRFTLLGQAIFWRNWARMARRRITGKVLGGSDSIWHG